VRDLATTSRALPAAAFTALRDGLLASPLVGATTLNGPFEASRGFACTFKATGRARLVERFAQLGPHLDAVQGGPAVRALTPWWKRTPSRVPNCWYLNVLLVSAGGTVGRHIDATLRRPSGVPDAVPELVSVLYLVVPRARGGDLRLYDGATPVARIFPEENLLVHFRGDLSHEVCPFEGPPGALRASLVLEQYHFEPQALARLPEFELDSRAGFGAYLEHHAERPPAPFELEPHR
jgi:hypothetical protein